MQKYRMAHTMLRVFDLERSIQFYEKVLGLRVIRSVDVPEHKFTLVFLGDGVSDFLLELTYNYGRAPYELGTGYGHIAFTVPDLIQSNEEHRTMGIECSPLRYTEDGTPRYYFIEDPDGYEIELLQE
ncbi:MAG: lactoylglutathione lyase [Armatimonadetes bacterium CG2_30_59_28]|nr:lactoylglutathione lyase [Armatimonadota bacterium]OIO93088.1 MAG: lactoylglutathione lyase [Armatimonadetes bacterium CG2_30_59_28]PIU60278.1 MAG: lactoylglutathione lyase [Armatimonadetes bacterium CG07_land_8_20_14_0_80_59_28]PIX41118.1 MAG: lactoylglutathione lyase [Armatimonadetes bacterium CG_4_8_14_3_um_filter_58_9]PIY44719.1 MAG: lactoylglutathione lyase [Armatimonadetes bacterium CG_4_10_14_3_um_filter_59_10]PJB72162.1 MAG: lactoylglutathione lyase [Armatimonadetes bacterium CG_4_9